GLDVAGGHRAWRTRSKQRTIRHHDLERFQATGIHRNVAVDQATEDIEHRRLRDRTRRVEIVGGLRAGACEVDYGRAPRAIDPDFHADDGAGVHRHLEFAVGEFSDHPTDRLLRIVLDMAHIGVDDGKSVYGASPAQP